MNCAYHCYTYNKVVYEQFNPPQKSFFHFLFYMLFLFCTSFNNYIGCCFRLIPYIMAAYMPAELCVVNNGAEYDSCKKSTHLSTFWSEHIEELFKWHGTPHGELSQKFKSILINLLLHFVLSIVATGDCT